MGWKFVDIVDISFNNIDNTIYDERIKKALEDNIFSIDDYPEATQDNWELRQK